MCCFHFDYEFAYSFGYVVTMSTMQMIAHFQSVLSFIFLPFLHIGAYLCNNPFVESYAFQMLNGSILYTLAADSTLRSYKADEIVDGLLDVFTTMWSS
jgi:hypothetical protein